MVNYAVCACHATPLDSCCNCRLRQIADAPVYRPRLTELLVVSTSQTPMSNNSPVQPQGCSVGSRAEAPLCTECQCHAKSKYTRQEVDARPHIKILTFPHGIAITSDCIDEDPHHKWQTGRRYTRLHRQIHKKTAMILPSYNHGIVQLLHSSKSPTPGNIQSLRYVTLCIDPPSDDS